MGIIEISIFTILFIYVAIKGEKKGEETAAKCERTWSVIQFLK